MTTVTTHHPTFARDDATFRTYNLWDCVATVRGAKALQEELRSNGQLEFWDQEVWTLVPSVLAMARRGMLLDDTARRSLQKTIQAELKEVDAVILAADPTGKLSEPTDNNPNSLGSGVKVARFLFEEGELKVAKRTDTGRPSVDQEALLRVLRDLRKKDEPYRVVLENLLHRSRLKTILQRYMGARVGDDGRVRATVKMGGTKTGRFAYDRPALQQIPPEIRRMFVPAPGHVFIAADYSQLEARIAAYLCQDQLDIEAFESGVDIHAQTACHLFDWSMVEWVNLAPAQRKAARNFAKGFRYGLMYGGSPETMKMKTFCPCPRCEDKLPPILELPRVKITEASERWLSLHPAIEKWRDSLRSEVVGGKSLTNALGRKRYFFQPWPGCKREVFNWPIQSVAADIINRAMRAGHSEYGLPFVLQMHDSLMVEVLEGDTPTVISQLREVMESPVPELGGVVFPVDVETYVEWGTAL